MLLNDPFSAIVADATLDRLPEPDAGTIVVCTLGGVADIGMNLTLYGAQGGWVLVDAGTTFPPRGTAGVEAVMPDPRFLAMLGGRLKGLVVSHYHEDHVGAITRYWPRYAKCPIFAPPFAARMLTGKFQDKGVRGEVKIKTFEPGTTLGLGPFRIRTIRVAHSTPDCVALALEAEGRRILHTNDWKIDENPGIGSRTDLGALAALGRQGVDLMLCDSTNADREAPQTSEASVRRALESVMRDTRGMVFVASFGSNVARMASVAQAAKAARRKVALAGRSLREAAAAAEALGLMKGVPRFLEDASKFGGTQRNGCVLMCTGTQGEDNASLAKLAGGRDPRLPKIKPGDTVVMSARAIPGNEEFILTVTDKLHALGARIVTAADRVGEDTVHVTGHPVRADLRIMYGAVKPRFAMPVHGGPTHLAAHAELALGLGVKAALTPVNGGVYQLSETGFECLGSIPSRLVAVLGDGAGTFVPWDDVEKVAILTADERERLDAQLEQERARGERTMKRLADRGSRRRRPSRQGQARPPIRQRRTIPGSLRSDTAAQGGCGTTFARHGRRQAQARRGPPKPKGAACDGGEETFQSQRDCEAHSRADAGRRRKQADSARPDLYRTDREARYQNELNLDGSSLDRSRSPARLCYGSVHGNQAPDPPAPSLSASSCPTSTMPRTKPASKSSGAW